jgi:4-hydroxy-tetrahydrodipicolinate synthase
MLPKTVLRLANDFKNIVCHQRSSRRYGANHANFEGQTKDFLVISGDDMILCQWFCRWCWVISVIGQGFPKEFSDMIRLGLNRKVDEAFRKQYLLSDCIDMILRARTESNKSSFFGIAENVVRFTTSFC